MFLGLGNFYRWFVKEYAIMARPMTDLTCKDVVFHFGEKECTAFKALKAAFTCAPVLQYPDQDCKFCLETNVSEFAIGGVISVKCVTSMPTPTHLLLAPTHLLFAPMSLLPTPTYLLFALSHLLPTPTYLLPTPTYLLLTPMFLL